MEASRTLRPKFRSPSAIQAALTSRQKSGGKTKGGRKQISRCSSEYSTTSSIPIPIRHRTPSSCSSEISRAFEKTTTKLQKQVEENKQKIADISTKTGSHDTRISALEDRMDEMENQQQSFAARLDNYERSGRIVCHYCNKNLSVSSIKSHWKKQHPTEDFLERLLNS